MSQPIPGRTPRRRRAARVAIVAVGAVVASTLTALSPAQAAITNPTGNPTLSGQVTLTESGGTNNCQLGQDKATSRLRVVRVADGAEVFTANRGSAGTLTATWNSVGQPRGQYRVDSWTKNSVRSGFGNLGCTAQSEIQQPSALFSLENKAAVSVSAPASVITGETLSVSVQTTVHATGIAASTVAPNRSVTITVPDVGTKTVTTDANGKASTTFDLPGLPYLPAGALPISAQVGDDALYVGESGNGSTTLTKRATGVIYAGDTRAQPDTRARLGGVLVDMTDGSAHFGEPIADQPMTLALASDSAVVETTASGRAIRSVPITGQSRILDATVSFGGDGVWLPSSDTVSFFVGDATAPQAPVEHNTVGGFTRAVGGLLGALLSPVTKAVGSVTTAVQSTLDKLVDTLLGAVGINADSLAQANMLHLASADQLNGMLDGLLGTVTSLISTSGDPIDHTLNHVLDAITKDSPLAELSDTARYQWRSVYVAPDGHQVAKQFGAIMEVPEPLDVTGDKVPDVLASVIVGLDLVPQLKIAKLSGAPADLPLSLQAVLSLSGDQYRFGYDTRTTNAPQKFEADIALGDAGATLQIASTSDQALAVTGAISPQGTNSDVVPQSDGEESNPDGSSDTTPALAPKETRFGVSFDPAPKSASLALAMPTDGSSLQDVAATLTTDQPTTVGINLVDDSGAAELFLANVLIEKVSGNLVLGLNGSDAGTMQADLRADGGLDNVEVTAKSLNDGRTESDIRLAMTEVPDTISFGMGSDGQGSMSASGPIGTFEAGYATGGRLVTLDDPAYLRVLQQGDYSSIALRLPGFEGMDLDMGDSVSLGLTMAATPLHAVVSQDGLDLDATITDAPHQLRLGLGTDGNIEISGSDPIAEVRLTGHNPAGIAMGATDLALTLTDIPKKITVSVGEDGAVFDTGGEPIGKLELLAGNGDLEPVPGEDDGLIMSQGGPAGLSLAARITGLRTISATLGEQPDILLDTVAGKIFAIQMKEYDDEGVLANDVTATIDHLVPNLRLGLVDDGSGAMQLHYAADEPTNSLTISMGGLSGSIADPLPAKLDVCMDGGTACLPDVAGMPENPALGSIRFSGSEYTTLNLEDPSRGMKVDNLRIRQLDLTGDLNADDGGPLYLNTSIKNGDCETPLAGTAWCEYPIRGGKIDAVQGDTKLSFTPGDGFSAVDARTDLEPTKILGQTTGVKGVGGTGKITCVSSTALKVTVSLLGLPITLDLKNAICSVPNRDPSNLG